VGVVLTLVLLVAGSLLMVGYKCQGLEVTTPGQREGTGAPNPGWRSSRWS
jgi:hypothetical protein